LRDLTGDYTLSLLASLTLSMAGTLSILLLPSTSHHQLPAWETALPPEVRSTPVGRPAATPGD
jgi:hypothetical protein